MSLEAKIMNTTSTKPAEGSWEDMQYGGLPEWTSVKNTFIDCPADRSWSLEEFMQMNEKKCKSCPNSGVMMHQPQASKLLAVLEESEGSTTDEEGAQTPPTEEDEDAAEPWENVTYGELPTWTCVKNTFIDCPADRSFSLDEQTKEQKCKSCPSSGVMMHDEASTATQAAEDVVVLSLAPMLQAQGQAPIFSIGSQAHQFGQCRPCGFVHKPEGCVKGASCPYCHLCPPGTIKERKQMKKTIIKMRKMDAFAARQRQQWVNNNMGYF